MRKKAKSNTPNLLTPIQLPIRLSTQLSIMKRNAGPSTCGRSKFQRKIKKPTGFLDLAGETRNQIYNLYFQHNFLCEFAGKEDRLGYRASNDYGGHLKRRAVFKFHNDEERAIEKAVRFHRTLGNYKRIDGLDTRWDTSLTGLVFVCKLVHTETIPLLYAHTTFALTSPSRIANFLRIPSAPLLANVTKVQLHYTTYGDPQLAKDVVYQNKHIRSWDRICRTVAKKLPNLQNLDIWVHVNESKVSLDMREPYYKPLQHFRQHPDPRKTIAKALRSINVRVDSRWNTPGVYTRYTLLAHSKHLHYLFGNAIAQCIMGVPAEEALKEYREYWVRGPCAMWHPYLQFGVPVVNGLW